MSNTGSQKQYTKEDEKITPLPEVSNVNLSSLRYEPYVNDAIDFKITKMPITWKVGVTDIDSGNEFSHTSNIEIITDLGITIYINTHKEQERLNNDVQKVIDALDGKGDRSILKDFTGGDLGAIKHYAFGDYSNTDFINLGYLDGWEILRTNSFRKVQLNSETRTYEVNGESSIKSIQILGVKDKKMNQYLGIAGYEKILDRLWISYLLDNPIDPNNPPSDLEEKLKVCDKVIMSLRKK